jgi:hypothetical protein
MPDVPVLWLRMIWQQKPYTLERLRLIPPIHVTNVITTPSPGHPVGQKGLDLASAWRQLSANSAGAILLDGDVAVDPVMAAQMMTAVGNEPGSVHTAAVRLWPVSTGWDDWAWGHCGADERRSQLLEDVAEPCWFSFSFTYIPRRVMDAADRRDGLRTWHYPNVDRSMSLEAQRLNVPVRVVPDCYPVHLHY